MVFSILDFAADAASAGAGGHCGVINCHGRLAAMNEQAR
jgi:hypothetical protein